ncbi:MAG: UDP-glucose 4-epimerase [Chloroflexota bacterium]|jgi:nucleoside-diphosphate-sugar epimerase|nr:UDP-glucose 4-epimerase [Chloroflexota bacterium]
MTETILITGGAGTLGRATTETLLARGDRVRILDLVGGAPRDGVEWRVGDLRRPDDVRRAVEGVDAIVHAAAWHGMHLRDHPASDFWELNVDGTFHVFEAAAEAGVARAVVASTMGVYGASRAPGPDGGAVRLHEGLPLLPVNVYELSKVLTETIAASYDLRAERGVRSCALRFGMFVPEPFLHSGIRFLYGGIDERDVAAAVVAGLDRTSSAEPGGFAAWNVFSSLPYDEADAADLPRDPIAVVRRHWPDAPSLLEAAGVAPWGPIREWYDVTRARDELGWQPRFGFDVFIAALREGRTEL